MERLMLIASNRRNPIPLICSIPVRAVRAANKTVGKSNTQYVCFVRVHLMRKEKGLFLHHLMPESLKVIAMFPP